MVKEYFKRFIKKEIPKGYIKNENTTTQPIGYSWYYNGESLFSGKKKIIFNKRQMKRKINKANLEIKKIRQHIRDFAYFASDDDLEKSLNEISIILKNQTIDKSNKYSVKDLRAVMKND